MPVYGRAVYGADTFGGFLTGGGRYGEFLYGGAVYVGSGPVVQTPGTVAILGSSLQRVQLDSNGVMTPYEVGSDVYGQRVVLIPQISVPFSLPPTDLSIGATELTLTSIDSGGYTGRYIAIQNITDDGSSPTSIYVTLDGTATIAGWRVKPGDFLTLDVPIVSTVNIWNPSSSVIPLNAASGIILGAWL